MANQITMYYHTLKNKKLEEAKLYLSDRYNSIEFIIEYENDIFKTTKLHSKDYEALIIIDTNNNVKSCSVKYINKIKSNNSCIII